MFGVINPTIFKIPSDQVEHELIYYVHDGSETVSDNFTVGANDTGLRKHSVGQTVYIQLTAVNDQPPVVTANRVLRVRLRCCCAAALLRCVESLFLVPVGLCGLLSQDAPAAELQVATAGWMREAMPVMRRRAQGAGSGGLAFIWKGPRFSCS